MFRAASSARRWLHLAVPAAYKQRTHTCGALTVADAGQHVVLNGWIQKARRVSDDLLFVPLRDGYGTTQLVLRGSTADRLAFERLRDSVLGLSRETIVSAEGIVQARASENVKEAGTGAIEVELKDLLVLNPADKLPFPVASAQPVGEELRLKHRYLDLRRPELQNNLRQRSRVARIIRETLYAESFTEVETPILFKSTPEGAREFLVPTRTPNRFYALAQSPQQYKQVLMSGGLDRYFQFAKCFRDENLRADRQPEFTQIDLEMSFAGPDQIFNIVEKIVSNVWKDMKDYKLPTHVPRLAYKEAISKFGSDKPDVRYDLSINNISALVPEWTLDGQLQAELVLVPAAPGTPSFTTLLGAVTKQFNGLGRNSPFQDPRIRVVGISDDGKTVEMRRRVVPNLSAATMSTLRGDGAAAFVILSPSMVNPASTVAGLVRSTLAAQLDSAGVLQKKADPWQFLWIVDFPLFTPSPPEPDAVSHDGALQSVHHPFTAPHPDDLPRLLTDPTMLRGLHYDLVLNGMELGGGSIRIHNAAMQEAVFRDILKLPNEETARFTHLLDALRLGCPPHGGLALGFDRIMALLCGANSLRDVIAFPKTHTGQELMVDSPSPVSERTLQMYHIRQVDTK